MSRSAEVIGIVRRCMRCKRWVSIDQYGEGARVCRPCMQWRGRVGNRGSVTRNIVITESGRELLDQWRREEAGAA